MKLAGCIVTLLVAGCLLSFSAMAHESRPAYLQLTLGESGAVALTFKAPALGQLRLGLYPTLPETCVSNGEALSFIADNAYNERQSFTCEGGLFGKTVGMDGLSSTLTDVLVRIERSDGTTQVARMTPSKPALVIEAIPGKLAVARTYLGIGVEHILLGIDHLLFVLALLILVQNTRTLVWTITAFTVAHSLTLAAATLGFVRFPQAPVEAVIALSIVFVASEIIHVSQGRPGLTQRKPWVVAFTFGLLHGFGFAGALTEVGLPQQAVPLALLFFNLGVELGQLAFVAAALSVIVVGRRLVQTNPLWLPRVSAYAIGIVASYWTVERITGFW